MFSLEKVQKVGQELLDKIIAEHKQANEQQVKLSAMADGVKLFFEELVKSGEQSEAGAGVEGGDVVKSAEDNKDGK